MFHITEQVEEVTILRTSCYGVRINQTARCPELSLRWRYMRKIQVRLTAPSCPESGMFVTPVFQVFLRAGPSPGFRRRVGTPPSTMPRAGERERAGSCAPV